MRRGKCPKCGSNDVRCRPGAGKWDDHGRIPGPGTLSSGLLVDRYICAACGFVETYVAREKDRRKVAEKWPLAIENPDR